MTTTLATLYFNPDPASDWYALHRGSWAIPEGTRAEWIAALNAIEHGPPVSFKRLAVQRLPSGNVLMWSPRNSSSPSDAVTIAAGDVERFVAMVREGLAWDGEGGETR